MGRPPRKYQPLGDYLAAREADEVTLTFPQLEGIIGTPLAPRAFTRAFWINHPRSRRHPSREWLRVGWRVVAAEPRRNQITFQRSRDITAPPDGP